MRQGQTSGNGRDPGAGRLRALVDLCGCLTTAEEPLQMLALALPEMLEHLGAKAGRLLTAGAEPGCLIDLDWPDAAAPELRAEVATLEGTGETPHATIEVCGKLDGSSFDADDQAFLDAVARLAGIGCGQARQRAWVAERQRLDQDVALAAELQRSLQPAYDPEDMPIWGVNRPARHISGDFFDFYRLDDERIAFALGDVSGKGMNAALLMAKSISLFRCLSKRIDGPGALLEAINAELCETAARGMFVTMVAGHYGLRDGRVRFANAGHEPPLWRRTDRSYRTFPATAPPLGILPGTHCPETEIALAGGEFYVFSDGLTEYRYASGEQLGTDGFIQLVEALAAEPPARRLESLLDMLDKDTGWEARDDLTVLAIDDAWAGTAAGIGAVAALAEATA